MSFLVPLSTPTQLPKAVQERRDSQLAEIPANLQERRGSTVSQTLYFELTFMVFNFSQLSLMFPTRNSRLLRFHDLNISRHTQKFMPVDFFSRPPQSEPFQLHLNLIAVT